MRHGPSLTLALLACLALAACGNDGDKSPDGQTDADGKTVHSLVYAGSNWYGHAPTWVGVKHGIFEKHGFDVEIKPFASSSERVTALEQDLAQFASLGEVAMLQAMAEGRDQFYWIGNQDIAPGAEGLVAREARTIADLKGKRIALVRNSSVHITVALLLKEAGLDITKDVEIVHVQDSEVANVVRAGDADAGATWEPYYTDLRSIKGATVLATDMDTSIYKEFKTMTGPDVVCCSRKWLDADPDRAKRLFIAYFEAVEWCRDNPDELVALIAERVGKETSVVAATLKNFKWLDRSQQRAVMSDSMMFGQAAVASQILHDMGTTTTLPAFRNWVRPDMFRD